MDKSQLGQLGEELAEKYLKNKGYTVLGRHFRKREGEIDIILRKDKTIIFTEVKARRPGDFGAGQDAVDYVKQERLAKTAVQFLNQNPDLADYTARFDVIAVNFDKDLQNWQIEHFEDAFGVSD